jgi:hypothetical protein
VRDARTLREEISEGGKGNASAPIAAAAAAGRPRVCGIRALNRAGANRGKRSRASTSYRAVQDGTVIWLGLGF